jgi:hypothetical protein
MLLRTAKAIFLLFILVNAVGATASSTDFRLMQLVPPEKQIVACMLTPSPKGKPSSFLLVTENNKIDHEDFFALTGADTSRIIRQVVFVAAGGRNGILSEHSLLVSGRFNRDAIFRSAHGGNATTVSYRDVTVLVVPAFERERSTFNEVRWLAILDSNLAIFGTVESVQRELDRKIANSPADPVLMERLSRLGREDESWCLLPAPARGEAVQSVFERLDPKLGAVAREGGSIQYGIHIGKQVEITASSNIGAQERPDSQDGSSLVEPPAAHSLLTRSDNDANVETGSAVVKVSQRRYNEWLAEFGNHSLTFDGTPSR